MDIAEVMKNEIDCAVQWWSQQLRQKTQHKTGDLFNDAIMHLVLDMIASKAIPDEQVSLFEESLRIGIIKLIEDAGIDVNDPPAGSYHRVVSTDYRPDEVLSTALSTANINDGGYRLPMKTIMWINPGAVSVAQGYGVQSITIYSVQDVTNEH